jgi:hypothetical protein
MAYRRNVGLVVITGGDKEKSLQKVLQIST